ncbi:protein wings apart-like isoform X3 [Aethina tumida]|uniref:protein wings apart-like isoform X3 n=1 Tax=Aethina tumida TaxID=116153 RepID=UPI002147281F|nr:protein wings apart-like isoform X3 [Aethina tumida]
MSRGYGKYRRGGSSHSSFLFDNLFKENSNRPSAARSAATVGKWGITSFTSIRTMNGMSRSENERSSTASTSPTTPEVDNTPKPKKFFKSRNTEPPDLEAAPPTGGRASKRAKITYDEKPTRGSPRKFFSHKANSPPDKSTVLTQNVNTSKQKQEVKPPIVLRICRGPSLAGKSQLLNDSDESESTPTPSSTPSTSTSPGRRASSETPRPANCRITRSARRSMQQDPSSSPATADTPSEFPSLFMSPEQDSDLSPQYIPAEKYELERKAMYETLLGGPVPPSATPSATQNEDMSATDSLDFGETKDNDRKPVEEAPSETASALDDKQEEDEDSVPEEPSVQDTSHENDDAGSEMEVEETIENIEAEIHSQIMNAAPVVPETPPVPHEPEKAKAAAAAPTSVEHEWSTDGDSNSADTQADAPPPPETARPHTIDDHKDQILDKILESKKPSPEHDTQQQPQVAPVKLVISKKKGSIFKSRAVAADGTATKNRRALYRHKWVDTQPATEGGVGGDGVRLADRGSAGNDYDFSDEPLERVSRPADDDDGESVTSVRCSRSDKGFYTVVRNVKKAHQIQEIGEFQEFNDDVEYILDALQDNNPISTRCLSAITLASKCMAPAFRMHVRAHGTVAKFFKALHDATRDQSLGLCTATVMFVLSQDRLNMDLDRDCLELMLNLLESDVSYQQALDVCGLSSQQLEKNKQKVRELCAEIQSQGHAMHLNLDAITVGQLAMETLLSLTSKRAGEWFKEELRELGGLEHIMKTISECCRQVSDYVVEWTDVLLDKLRKVDRCLRVLENVTHNNEENQQYILRYENGAILDTLVNLYKLCDGEIPLYPVTDIKDKSSTGTIIREALLVTLKVLINLTHHFNKQSQGGALIGSRPGIVDTSLHLLLQVPHYIPEQKKFELGVLVLMLLINLIQDQNNNKKLLMEAKAPSKLESIYSREESAVEALIVQFYHWEGCAKIAEKKTNAILDGEKDGDNPVQAKSNEEFIEETVAKLLQKAGTHMEYTFLASYIGMLMGFLIMDNPEYQQVVRSHLKGNNFCDMVELLKKFYNFMNLTSSTEASSVCAIKATQKVIKYLEDCDGSQQGETHSEGFTPSAECMDLSYKMAHSQ